MALAFEKYSPTGSMRMEVSTLAFTPLSSSADWSASELMIVASMPIWSPFTRSKPFLAPVMPRKMLPPPMTMPICTPAAAAAPICSA